MSATYALPSAPTATPFALLKPLAIDTATPPGTSRYSPVDTDGGASSTRKKTAPLASTATRGPWPDCQPPESTAVTPYGGDAGGDAEATGAPADSPAGQGEVKASPARWRRQAMARARRGAKPPHLAPDWAPAWAPAQVLAQVLAQAPAQGPARAPARARARRRTPRRRRGSPHPPARPSL